MTKVQVGEGASIVRYRTVGDIAQAAEVLRDVHAVDGYPVEGVDNPRAWLESSGLIQAWVAEKDGKVVGHVAVSEPQAGDEAAALARPRVADGEIAVLGRLFISPSARKNSLGELLVRAATEFAADHNLRLVLDVMEKDQSAIRLYERLGWRFIGSAGHTFGDGKSIPARCYISQENNYDVYDVKCRSKLVRLSN
jgi:ribosomal protein S18 acetylase RimI-like enzyme